MSDVAKLTVSVPEAARMLGIGRNSAYALVAKGEIPSLRLGHRVVVPMRALEQMIELAIISKTAA